MKLLLIEDDRSIALAIARALANTYAVDIADTGKTGLAKVQTGAYELIVLDLNLPDIPGKEVCEQIRKYSASLPLLVLTGDDKVLTKIKLLDAGADDYLTKPFSLGELKVRLRAIHRRVTQQKPKQHVLELGDLSLDSDRHTVERDGQPIRLRRKEFSLLECLMQNAGNVVTRDILSHHAWRENEDPWTNTIDVHIKYLRDKVDRPFDKQLIKTVHGLGYKLELPISTNLESVTDTAPMTPLISKL